MVFGFSLYSECKNNMSVSQNMTHLYKYTVKNHRLSILTGIRKVLFSSLLPTAFLFCKYLNHFFAMLFNFIIVVCTISIPL